MSPLLPLTTRPGRSFFFVFLAAPGLETKSATISSNCHLALWPQQRPAVCCSVALFALVIRYGVIAREEAYLERKFGDVYRRYRARVRRWL
jgi:protein-S-isoprenylcysteine O-methyltransferase Ste14